MSKQVENPGIDDKKPAQSGQRLKILIASSIDKMAIKSLEADQDVVCAFGAGEDQLISLIPGCQVLVFRSGVTIGRSVLQAADQLKLLIRAGSGTDNIDLAYLAENPHLKLVRVPEPGARAVAEMSFATMLALSRRLCEADRLTRQGRWAKQQLTGYLLKGKTLGIVGAGNIGTLVAKMGAAWGMSVIGCVDPHNASAAENRSDIPLTSLEEVVRKADYLSIHVPLLPTTRNLLNKKLLTKMKRGSYLINLARGGVVNEEALREVLLDGQGPAGAAMDVHEHEGEGHISPLADLDNVILTPHIGAATFDSQREIGNRVIELVGELRESSAGSGLSPVLKAAQ